MYRFLLPLVLGIAVSLPGSAQDIIIVEFIQDPVSVTDANGEWFEVFNTTGSDIDLNGWTISDSGTNSHTISGTVVVPSGGFAVLCVNSDTNTNGGFVCDYEYSSFTLANGDDEIILTDPSATEVDRVEYDGGPNWPDPSGASVVFTAAASADNNDPNNWTTASTREASYSGSAGDLGSPGTSGVQQSVGSAADPTVTQQPDNVEGYRLLSVPVQNYTVGDLAELNLVQGVAGQYPDGEDNVFIDYAPTTNNANDDTYVPATSTADALEPGRGFFWYLFNNDVVPDPNSFGGGTSRSYDLADRPFSATGPVIETSVSRTFPESANGFYMIGNPFAQTFETDNLSYTGTGTLATTLQAYDPSTGYQPITIAAGTYLATWQGVFAEVSGGTGAAQFNFAYDAADAGNTATFYGRRAEAVLKLALDGQLDSGAEVHDRAAWIDLSSDGTPGWDRYDASKLIPPTADLALIAPVGTRDGAPYRQAVLSTGGIQSGTLGVPLAFCSTGDGTFMITPTGTASLPNGTTATLVDRVAGTSAPLVEGQAVTFSASAGDWTERFEVQFSSASTAGEDGPDGIEIGAVRPNPSAGSARLVVRTSGAEVMTATVFDALGRQVAVAFDGVATGETTVSLPSDLAPGVYVVRVQGATFGESRPFVVTR